MTSHDCAVVIWRKKGSCLNRYKQFFTGDANAMIVADCSMAMLYLAIMRVIFVSTRVSHKIKARVISLSVL